MSSPNRTHSFENPVKDRVRLVWLKRMLPPTFPSLNIIREIGYYFGITYPVVPTLSFQTLRLYDLRKRTLRTFELPVSFSCGVSYCFERRDTLLCVGGYPEVNTTIRLTVTAKNATVSRLQPMHTARAFPGVFQYESYLYIFGGNHCAIRKCEKFHLTQEEWTNIPDMTHPRKAFTPCLHHSDLYLVDISQYPKVVEVFHIAREEFSVLSIDVPSHCFYYSVSVIEKGEMHIVAGNGNHIRWKLEKSGSCMQRTNISMKINPTCNSGPPLVYENAAYYSDFDDGQLVRFELSSSTLENDTDFEPIS